MGDEGPRGCPAVLHLQHRGLDLEVLVRGERRAQARIDRGPGAHREARLLANDQVEVAAAHALLIAELGVQVRQRQDRLRGDRPVAREHRQLATATRDDLTRDEYVVTEVDEVLPALEGLLAHLGERDHGLDALSVTRLQARETQLARVAQVHHAAGDADDVAGGGIRFELGVLRPQGGNGRRDAHADRVGAGARVDEPLTLLQPHGLLLGDFSLGQFGGGCGVVGHEGQSYRGGVGAPPPPPWFADQEICATRRGAASSDRRFSAIS